MPLNIPNWLTLLRLCLVPAVIVAIGQHEWDFAFAGFAIAGFTDALDGYIARRFNQMTALGALLDPIADKALLISIYAALGIVGNIPPWLVIMVISRDVMIMGAVVVSWLLDNPVEINPLKISKANTLSQILLAGYLLGTLSFSVEFPVLRTGLITLVSGLTLASMGAYLALWVKHMAEESE